MWPVPPQPVEPPPPPPDAKRLEQEERDRRAWLAAQPTRAMTLGDLEGRDLPTLAHAAAIVDFYGGRVELAEHGGFVVHLPDRLSQVNGAVAGMVEQEARNKLRTAVHVLVAASAVVATELARPSREPIHERLPDTDVLAGGSVDA
jgi:hypothetical protein